MSAPYEAMESTVNQFLQSYIDAGRTKDMKYLYGPLTHDCRRGIGPPAFIEPKGAPPDFTMSNEEYATEFSDMALYEFSSYTIHELVIDAQKLRVAVRTELLVQFYNGDKSSRSFVFFLDFVEDGSKIYKIYQLNDTEEGNNWLENIKRRKAAAKEE